MWRALNTALAAVAPRLQTWLSVQEARVRGRLIAKGLIKPRVLGCRAEGFALRFWRQRG